jgi:hypothetical protein
MLGAPKYTVNSIHRVFDAVPLLVDLLDDDLGIAESQ